MGDESDSAKKIDEGQAPPLVNTTSVRSEQVLVDYGLLKDREATDLAGALERFADKLIDQRGLTGRYSGIDAYQAMLCAILANAPVGKKDRRGCVDRKADFATTTHWLFWLIGNRVDEFGRHPEPPLGDDAVDLPSDDDIERQIDAERRLAALLNAVSQTEFAELIRLIDFRKNRETLAEMLGMDVNSLGRMLKRFDYFVKGLRS